MKHIAGILYLTSILTGAAAAFVRWRLVIPNDAWLTTTNILAHESLFRLLLGADLISAVCYVGGMLLFYEIFEPLHKHLALLTTILSVVSGVMVIFGCVFHLAVIALLHGAQNLHILTLQPLAGLALTFLRFRAQAYGAGLLVFALNSMFLGYLVTRSRVEA